MTSMKLNGPQREQLYRALMDAFRKRELLERMVNFGLETSLEAITSDKDLPTTVFELIDWAESQGRLSDLVEGAYAKNPKNPELRDFVEQIWKPLQAQNEPTPLVSKQAHRQASKLHTKAQTPTQSSQVIEIDTRKRSRRATSGRQKTPSGQGGVETAPLPLLFPEGSSAKQASHSPEAVLLHARQHVDTARKAIQTVIDLIQPEKDVYRDQCQFAVLKVKEAASAIQKIPEELAQISSVRIPTRSLVRTEQVYFCDEASKVVEFFHQFSNQTSSLPLRKGIWDKLHGLMKSLEELNRLIDDFGIRVGSN